MRENKRGLSPIITNEMLGRDALLGVCNEEKSVKQENRGLSPIFALPKQLKNKSRLALFYLPTLLLWMFGAHAEPATKVPAAGSEKAPQEWTLKDYLCSFTPIKCNPDLAKSLYFAPPGTVREMTLNNKKLRVPMSYVSLSDLFVDSNEDRYGAHLEAEMPNVMPRTPQNLHEFVGPYPVNKVLINVGFPRAGAIPWSEGLMFTRRLELGRSSQPIRKPDKFGLEVWGENFANMPEKRPCTELAQTEPPCKHPRADDVMTPIKPNGYPSQMVCTPGELPDIDEKMTVEQILAERKKRGVLFLRAVCRHDLYLPELDFRLRLHYPRKFLPQWRQTEDRVRALLISFAVNESAATR